MTMNMRRILSGLRLRRTAIKLLLKIKNVMKIAGQWIQGLILQSVRTLELKWE